MCRMCEMLGMHAADADAAGMVAVLRGVRVCAGCNLLAARPLLLAAGFTWPWPLPLARGVGLRVT